MTTIHIIGSEGFIGRSIQAYSNIFDLQCWTHRNPDPNFHFNLLDPSTWINLLNQNPTHVILLSWPGLPNYQERYHLTHNLPASISLIDQLASSGLKRILVAGTCYEYGLQNGCLTEDQITDPINCYAIAKDSFRRALSSSFNEYDFELVWARIFYPYGNNQNPKSFFPSLKHAIETGQSEFLMSSGRQIRDFISVEDVACALLELITNNCALGIYNIGSGTPISLREFAQQYIDKSSSTLKLNCGAYPDRQDEPLCFWADVSKLKSLQHLAN